MIHDLISAGPHIVDLDEDVARLREDVRATSRSVGGLLRTMRIVTAVIYVAAIALVVALGCRC